MTTIPYTNAGFSSRELSDHLKAISSFDAKGRCKPRAIIDAQGNPISIQEFQQLSGEVIIFNHQPKEPKPFGEVSMLKHAKKAWKDAMFLKYGYNWKNIVKRSLTTLKLVG